MVDTGSKQALCRSYEKNLVGAKLLCAMRLIYNYFRFDIKYFRARVLEQGRRCNGSVFLDLHY